MKRIFAKTILLSLLLCLNTIVSLSQVKTSTLVTGLDTPWEILWGPDNNIWMTERYGRVSIVSPETGEIQEILKITDVLEDGERGLMGMVLHPDFSPPIPEFTPKRYVYLVYNYGTAGNTKVKIVRYTYNFKALDSATVLMQDIPGAWNHDGSRLWIDPKDYTLYVTMGDAGRQENSQNLSSLNGKILRMNLDGSIPKNNPYPNSYVWSYGHRNPQGFVVANGIMYSSEHGPDSDDELNIIVKGRNYGWPNVKGFCDFPAEQNFCESNAIAEPIAAWTPTLAVCGIDYYNSDLIPEWKNSILMTNLKASSFLQMKLDESHTKIESQTQFFVNQFGRLRDICISPDGRVFIATSNKDGRGKPIESDDRIIEISPNVNEVNEFFNREMDINVFTNPTTNSISFLIEPPYRNSFVRITDILGNVVKKGNFNENRFEWDKRDDYGNICKTGIYFSAINIDGINKYIKLVVY